MPSFHIIDRWVAAAKLVALIAPTVYMLPRGMLQPEKPKFFAYLIIVAILFITLEILQIVGIWRHKKWGFGLTAGLYVFTLLSGIIITLSRQVSSVPLRPVSIVDWHDVYTFPIALYCAYRYITFYQRENKNEF